MPSAPVGASTAPGGIPVEGYFLPILFTFYATGGTGTYTWSEVQYVNSKENIQYRGGVHYRHWANNLKDGLLPHLFEGEGNPVAFYSDTPGLVSPMPGLGYGPIWAAVMAANFTLQVSVTSGNQTVGYQTVNCPTVYWQAWEVWQNGIPSGADYVISPLP